MDTLFYNAKAPHILYLLLRGSMDKAIYSARSTPEVGDDDSAKIGTKFQNLVSFFLQQRQETDKRNAQ
jgi:hypothetical protein